MSNLSNKYRKGEITIKEYEEMGWHETWIDFTSSPKYKNIFTYEQL